MLPPGVYTSHKPVGPSSHAHVRDALELGPGQPLSGACHGGTLDPFAEGLLLILVGPATHFFEYLHELPKVYEAEIAWGTETDNGDGTGNVVREAKTQHLSAPLLDTALGAHLGWQEQTPPSTSAKKLGGEPAYKKVHRGESVELPPSRVYLHEAQWLSHSLPSSSRLRLVCRGGYYVRSLVRDLGRQLESAAHVRALRRVAIGPWACPPLGRPLPSTPLLPWVADRLLSDAECGKVRKGEPIPHGPLQKAPWQVPAGFPAPTPLVLAWHQQRLVALLVASDTGLDVRKLLPRGRPLASNAR